MNFRFENALAASAATDLFRVVETAGAANLPNQVGRIVQHRGGAIVDINIDAYPFSQTASGVNGDASSRGPAATYSPVSSKCSKEPSIRRNLP